MKVNGIQNYSNLQNLRGNKIPSFKGALSVNFWDAIARGGFAASFTIQDVLGTGIPRTYQASQRNKDITGKNNYKAAAEVAIREALTGPSMCIIPMLVLGLAKKTAGSAAEVPLDNIAVFSDEMKKILKAKPRAGIDIKPEYIKDVKSGFYEKMFALALDEKHDVPDCAKELAKMIKEYDSAPKRGFLKQLLNKNIVDKKTGSIVKSKDQLLGDMVNKFTGAKKDITSNYSSVLTTDMAGKLKKKNSIDSLIKDFSNFANDVDKSMTKYMRSDSVTKSAVLRFDSFMNEFKSSRTGIKLFTNIAMVGATALFLTQIPKLYTLYKTNPETDAIRQTQQGGDVSANQ